MRRLEERDFRMDRKDALPDAIELLSLHLVAASQNHDIGAPQRCERLA